MLRTHGHLTVGMLSAVDHVGESDARVSQVPFPSVAFTREESGQSS